MPTAQAAAGADEAWSVTSAHRTGPVRREGALGPLRWIQPATQAASLADAAGSRRAVRCMPSLAHLLHQHLALAVHLGQHVAALEGHQQLHHVGGVAEPVADGEQQVLDALAGAGRDGHRAGVALGELVDVGCGVGLVEAQQLGDVGGADVGQHLAHGIDVGLRVRGRAVDHVDQQVGLGGHPERGAERLHQLVGQLAHEAHGVGEQHGLAAGELQAPGGGVERGEQPILHQHPGAAQAVEQRGLAGVGVADDGHLGGPAAPAALVLGVLVGRHGAQVGLELVDPAGDASTIGLELGLARTAGADPGAAAGRHAAGLLRQALALAAKPGLEVAELGQLHLGPALHARGVLGEDVEDHGGAVERGAAEELLQVALLGGAQLVVEHHGVAVERHRQVLELVGLALAQVGGGVGGHAPLDDPTHHVGAGGVHQQGQLVEVELGLLHVAAGEGDAHDDDALPEGAVDERVGAAAVVAERATVALLGLDAGGVGSSSASTRRSRSRSEVEVVGRVEVVGSSGLIGGCPRWPRRCSGRGGSWWGRPRPRRRRRACAR